MSANSNIPSRNPERSIEGFERHRPDKATPKTGNDRGADRPYGLRVLTEEPVAIHSYVDLKKTIGPPRFVINPIVPRGSLYTFTAPANAGTTTLCSMFALAVATGRSDILDLDAKRWAFTNHHTASKRAASPMFRSRTATVAGAGGCRCCDTVAAALALDAILVSFALRSLDHAFPLTIFQGIATAVFAFDAEDKTQEICATVEAVANCGTHLRNCFLFNQLDNRDAERSTSARLVSNSSVRNHNELTSAFLDAHRRVHVASCGAPDPLRVQDSSASAGRAGRR